jgi:hypothetical protein
MEDLTVTELADMENDDHVGHSVAESPGPAPADAPAPPAEGGEGDMRGTAALHAGDAESAPRQTRRKRPQLPGNPNRSRTPLPLVRHGSFRRSTRLALRNDAAPESSLPSSLPSSDKPDVPPIFTHLVVIVLGLLLMWLSWPYHIYRKSVNTRGGCTTLLKMLAQEITELPSLVFCSLYLVIGSYEDVMTFSKVRLC